MPEDATHSAARQAVGPGGRPQWLGASVHLFTALGSLCALAALLATWERAYEQAFGWLFVALVIDAVDGTLARAADVEANVPRFSGERLDLVIDYLTYVFIPVVILLQAGVLSGWAGRGLAGLVLLSSLFHFADTESKTEDNCFVGFPAVWNLVAFCLLAWGLRGWLAALIVAVLVVLTFVPMRWLHPFRVKWLFTLNIGVTVAALGAALWILWFGFPAGYVSGSILALAALYYLGLAIVSPRAAAQGS